MTLGRVTQLPASRGQAGYRAQARLAFRRALANEVGMPLVLLGRAGKYSASWHGSPQVPQPSRRS
jgi:hypothetical protein